MKVENMTSSRGNKVANQFLITDNGDEYFQSYRSMIAKRSKGKIYLDEYYWDYSVTTMKHLYNFLRQWGHDLNKKKVLQLIEDGVFTLTNLNKV